MIRGRRYVCLFFVVVFILDEVIVGFSGVEGGEGSGLEKCILMSVGVGLVVGVVVSLVRLGGRGGCFVGRSVFLEFGFIGS